ncbi:hypothetical protein MUK42_01887 [Musa troglodytarum]|uniref:Uncharacterized protein n=1 Tax=Musa troglodytarum TaxID=320322 RepID=A0A9E7EVG0_9LILI|nr:hypothetical protein MUK42_01887 [Musa troglodytarum]
MLESHDDSFDSGYLQVWTIYRSDSSLVERISILHGGHDAQPALASASSLSPVLRDDDDLPT